MTAYPTYNKTTEQHQFFAQPQCFTPSTKCQGSSIQQPSVSHSSAAFSNLQQAPQPSQPNAQSVYNRPAVNACANILQDTATVTLADTRQPLTQPIVLPSYGSTALPPQSDTVTITSAGILQPSTQQTVLPLYGRAALPPQSDGATIRSASIQRPTIHHTVLPSYSGTTLPPQTIHSNSLDCNSAMASHTVNAGSTNACQATQVPNSLYAQSNNVPTTLPTLNMQVSAKGGTPIDPGSCTQNNTPFSKKQVYPDNFDGSGKTEWSDYIVHFEQCANWNQWSDSQKAQMLSIHLRGEAQRLLSGLTVAQLTNYHAMKQIITDRYEPKEKDVAYRCQFRYRKRDKGESASDYGYHLNRLAQKAYPNLTFNQLEIHVTDQFITGLANYELQKHVQFGHPKSLHEAIGLATEYEALEGSVDRIRKPTIESEKIAPILTQNSDNQQPVSLTLEQIGKLIDKKLNSLSVNTRPRSRNPTPVRVQSASKQTREPKNTTSNNQAVITEKQTPKFEKYCTYCKRNSHTIEECRTRKYHERKRQESNQKNCDAAYVITSQEQSMTVPQIIITPTDACEDQPKRQGDTSNTEVRLPGSELSESNTLNRQVLQPIITSQIHEHCCEVTPNIATASCLCLNTDIFQTLSYCSIQDHLILSSLSNALRNCKLSMTYNL